MRCAYDGTLLEILEGATKMTEWLRSADPHVPQDLLDANYYQTVKQPGSLVHGKPKVCTPLLKADRQKDIYAVPALGRLCGCPVPLRQHVRILHLIN